MRTVLLTLSALAALGCAEQQPLTPAALGATAAAATRRDVTGPRYRIDKLPILAGTTQGAGISNRGWVAGYSVATDGLRHAVLWDGSGITDLGQAGLISLPQWPGISSSSAVAGITQITTPDTLGESWSCAAFMGTAGKVCLGFAYYGGTMHTADVGRRERLRDRGERPR